MTDERLARAVSSWLDETDTSTPDLDRSVRHAMSHIQQTPQFDRRWSWRSLWRAKTSALAADQTTDDQPTSSPATNARIHHGHTPSVIGRTQTMLSPSKAITAGAIVFALGGAFLIAQPFQQPGSVPGAATDVADWTYFTWTLSDPQRIQHQLDGTWRGYGLAVEATDPRATGVLDVAWNATGSGPDDHELQLWQLRAQLTNDDGSWSGSGSFVANGLADVEPAERTIESWELLGDGAYEGLSLIMVGTEQQGDEERWGMIVPSDDVPILPDPTD